VKNHIKYGDVRVHNRVIVK